MIDIEVKPYRKTLRQTAVILNVSEKTIRRYLDEGKLKWSGNQVLLESIITYLNNGKENESAEEIEEKLIKAQLIKKPISNRRIISKGVIQ